MSFCFAPLVLSALLPVAAASRRLPGSSSSRRFVRSSSSFRDCARAPRVLLRIRELYFY